MHDQGTRLCIRAKGMISVIPLRYIQMFGKVARV